MQFNPNTIFAYLSINKELLEHSIKTAVLCRETRLALPQGFTDLSPGELYFAGLMHDIGKATWPECLFGKPKHVLTEKDQAKMRDHPLEGVRIVKKLMPGISENILNLIVSHHERPGGTGYPTGIQTLTNEALLLAACDVYCACTEKRQYRKRPFTTGAALDAIREFAPMDVVNAIAYQRIAIGY